MCVEILYNSKVAKQTIGTLQYKRGEEMRRDAIFWTENFVFGFILGFTNLEGKQCNINSDRELV